MAGQNPTAGGAMQPQGPGLGNIGQPQTPYTPPQNPTGRPRRGQRMGQTMPGEGSLGPMQPQTPYTPPQNQPGFNLSEYGERIQALDQGDFSGGDLRGYGRAIQEFNRPYGPQPTPGYPQQAPPPWMQPGGPGGPGGPRPWMDSGWSNRPSPQMQEQIQQWRDQRTDPAMNIPNTAGKGSTGGSMQPQPGSVMDFGRKVRQFNAPQRPMPQYNPDLMDRDRWEQQRGMDRQYQDFRQRKGYLGGEQGNLSGMFRNGGVVQQGNLQGVWDRPLQDKRSDWRSRRFMG